MASTPELNVYGPGSRKTAESLHYYYVLLFSIQLWICDHRIHMTLNKKFYRIAAQPIMLYSIECWVVRKQYAHKTSFDKMRMV